MLAQPLLDHLGPRLVTQSALGDVDRLGELKEKQKQEQQDAEHGDHPLAQASHDVREHYCRSRKKVKIPGTTAVTIRPASA